MLRTIALLFLFVFIPHAATASRPNVLLICVDDLKPLLACYGEASVKTPNIDSLAARGMRFDRAYCNQAICAPSRYSLLTGMRPQTLGIYDLGTNFRHAAPDAVTLPQLFKQHGWHASSVGKTYHITQDNHDDPASWSEPSWWPSAKTYQLAESRKPDSDPNVKVEMPTVPGQPGERLPRGAAYESADVPDDAYADGKTADEAMRRLQAAAKKPEQPFFLAVGFNKPHLPFCAPKKYWDLYDRASFELPKYREMPEGAPAYAATSWGELRQYAGIPNSGPLSDDLVRELIHAYHAATSYTDAQVGKVIDELERLGLAENTIIVFWGDHGYHLGDHGLWSKHTNYENGARIPLLMVAPGVTMTSGSTKSLAETVDIYPTLCDLAGLEGPENLDGVSLAKALADAAADSDGLAVHVYPRAAILGRAVRTPRYRLVEWKRPGEPAESAELELYDYESDPLETKNLAKEQPDIVAELRAILAKQPEAKVQLQIPEKQKATLRKAANAVADARKFQEQVLETAP
jgi:iduronate 2-sulfatase